MTKVQTACGAKHKRLLQYKALGDHHLQYKVLSRMCHRIQILADRVDVSMDYSAIPTWDDDEEDDNPKGKGVKLFKCQRKLRNFSQCISLLQSPIKGGGN